MSIPEAPDAPHLRSLSARVRELSARASRYEISLASDLSSLAVEIARLERKNAPPATILPFGPRPGIKGPRIDPPGSAA